MQQEIANRFPAVQTPRGFYSRGWNEDVLGYRLGIRPGLCQVFEDGDSGIQGARAAGMVATDVRLFI
jgi:hypothetical protein